MVVIKILNRAESGDMRTGIGANIIPKWMGVSSFYTDFKMILRI
jgi:hypothetical protein